MAVNSVAGSNAGSDRRGVLDGSLPAGLSGVNFEELQLAQITAPAPGGLFPPVPDATPWTIQIPVPGWLRGAVNVPFLTFTIWNAMAEPAAAPTLSELTQEQWLGMIYDAPDRQQAQFRLNEAIRFGKISSGTTLDSLTGAAVTPPAPPRTTTPPAPPVSTAPQPYNSNELARRVQEFLPRSGLNDPVVFGTDGRDAALAQVARWNRTYNTNPAVALNITYWDPNTRQRASGWVAYFGVDPSKVLELIRNIDITNAFNVNNQSQVLTDSGLSEAGLQDRIRTIQNINFAASLPVISDRAMTPVFNANSYTSFRDTIRSNNVGRIGNNQIDNLDLIVPAQDGRSAYIQGVTRGNIISLLNSLRSSGLIRNGFDLDAIIAANGLSNLITVTNGRAVLKPLASLDQPALPGVPSRPALPGAPDRPALPGAPDRPGSGEPGVGDNPETGQDAAPPGIWGPTIPLYPSEDGVYRPAPEYTGGDNPPPPGGGGNGPERPDGNGGPRRFGTGLEGDIAIAAGQGLINLVSAGTAAIHYQFAERRTSGAVNQNNVLQELAALQQDPDTYLRSNYTNSILGFNVGDRGYNLTGRLFEMEKDGQLTYFRRVPDDIYQNLLQRQRANGINSDRVFVNELIDDGNGNRVPVWVEIRAPVRVEGYQFNTFTRGPTGDGSNVWDNIDLGGTTGFTFGVDEGYRLSGEGVFTFDPTSSGISDRIRIGFPTQSQAPGIGYRTQDTTTFARASLAYRSEFNGARVRDITPGGSNTGLDGRLIWGESSIYFVAGQRSRNRVDITLPTATNTGGAYARVRDTSFIEFGPAAVFFGTDDWNLNYYHEGQFYPNDFREQINLFPTTNRETGQSQNRLNRPTYRLIPGFEDDIALQLTFNDGIKTMLAGRDVETLNEWFPGLTQRLGVDGAFDFVSGLVHPENPKAPDPNRYGIGALNVTAVSGSNVPTAATLRAQANSTAVQLVDGTAGRVVSQGNRSFLVLDGRNEVFDVTGVGVGNLRVMQVQGNGLVSTGNFIVDPPARVNVPTAGSSGRFSALTRNAPSLAALNKGERTRTVVTRDGVRLIVTDLDDRTYARTTIGGRTTVFDVTGSDPSRLVLIPGSTPSLTSIDRVSVAGSGPSFAEIIEKGSRRTLSDGRVAFYYSTGGQDYVLYRSRAGEFTLYNITGYGRDTIDDFIDQLALLRNGDRPGLDSGTLIADATLPGGVVSDIPTGILPPSDNPPTRDPVEINVESLTALQRSALGVNDDAPSRLTGSFAVFGNVYKQVFASVLAQELRSGSTVEAAVARADAAAGREAYIAFKVENGFLQNYIAGYGDEAAQIVLDMVNQINAGTLSPDALANLEYLVASGVPITQAREQVNAIEAERLRNAPQPPRGTDTSPTRTTNTPPQAPLDPQQAILQRLEDEFSKGPAPRSEIGNILDQVSTILQKFPGKVSEVGQWLAAGMTAYSVVQNLINGLQGEAGAITNLVTESGRVINVQEGLQLVLLNGEGQVGYRVNENQVVPIDTGNERVVEVMRGPDALRQSLTGIASLASSGIFGKDLVPVGQIGNVILSGITAGNRIADLSKALDLALTSGNQAAASMTRNQLQSEIAGAVGLGFNALGILGGNNPTLQTISKVGSAGVQVFQAVKAIESASAALRSANASGNATAAAAAGRQLAGSIVGAASVGFGVLGLVAGNNKFLQDVSKWGGALSGVALAAITPTPLAIIGAVVGVLSLFGIFNRKPKTIEITDKLDVTGDGSNDKVSFRRKDWDYYYDVNAGDSGLKLNNIDFKLEKVRVHVQHDDDGWRSEKTLSDRIAPEPGRYGWGSDDYEPETGERYFLSLTANYDALFPGVTDGASASNRLDIDRDDDGGGDLIRGGIELTKEQYEQLLAAHGAEGQIGGANVPGSAFQPFISQLGNVRFVQTSAGHGMNFYMDVNGDGILDRVQQFMDLDKIDGPRYENDPEFRVNFRDVSGREYLQLAGDNLETLAQTGALRPYILAYIASHRDLIAAFGTDIMAAMPHFMAHAQERGITFDPSTYMLANLDVLTAFGNDPAAAAIYYIQHGHNENRSMALPSVDVLAAFPAIAQDPAGVLKRIAVMIPSLWSLAVADPATITARQAAEIVSALLNVAPEAAPAVLEALMPGALYAAASQGYVQPNAPDRAGFNLVGDRILSSLDRMLTSFLDLMVRGTAANGIMRANDAIQSANGRYVAVMQGDGNMVVYDYGTGRSIWDSGTAGLAPGGGLVMQSDGNLVVYDVAGQAQWNTGTAGPGINRAMTLVMQDDGNLVVYDSKGGTALWSSMGGRIAAAEPDFLLQTGTGLHETGDDFAFKMYDWNGDGRQDTIALKKSATGTGSTEVHIYDGATNFATPLLHTGTMLHETGENFEFEVADWNGDGTMDLVAIKKNATGTGSTEIHVYDGKTNFSTALLHTGTMLHETGNNFEFEIADWNNDGKLDLAAFKKSETGTASTEVHVFDGATNFVSALLHTGTALHETGDNFHLGLVDHNRDGVLDMVAIKQNGTGSQSTEVHIFDGASNFSTPLMQSGTALQETAGNFAFDIADWNADGRADLAAIKQSQTGTGTTEVHIVNAALGGGDNQAMKGVPDRVVNGVLAANQFIRSSDQRYTAIMQTDGNFVVYDNGKAIWSSGTNGKAAGGRVAMQADGNVVVYDAAGSAKWDSGSWGSGVNRDFTLVMQTDGNLVAYDNQNGEAVWSSQGHRARPKANAA